MRALRLFWMPKRSSLDCRRDSAFFLPYSPRRHLFIVEEMELERVADVAEILQVGEGIQAIGAAWVAGHEDEVAVLRAVLAPLQIVLDLDGLVVFVGAEEADVEVVARVLEVVGIAAEEGDVELGREHEADVGISLVGVEVILAALVERDHVGAQAGLLLGFGLDPGHGLALGNTCRGVVHVGLHVGHDLVGHVLDADQHVQFQVGGLDLIGLGLRQEPVPIKILLVGADLLEGVGADVVVGHHQAVGRDERPRSARVEPDRRESQVVEPGFGGLEVVFLLERLEREVVEDPHSFVGLHETSEQQSREGEGGDFAM